MKDMIQKLQNEEGYLIVESCFVYPIVMLCVLLLIFIGIFGLQSQMVFLQINEVAQIGTEMTVNPNYAELNDMDLSDTTAVRKYYQDINPYRYFNFSFSAEKTKLKQLLQERVQNFCILNSTRFVSCDANISNYVLTQKVKITVQYTMELPKVFSLIGMNHTFSYTNSVTYQAMDPAEFVRNTDLTYDIGKSLAKKFGIDSKIETFLQKMKDIKNKFS